VVYLHTPTSEKLQKEAEGGSGEQGKYLEEVKELEGILPDIDSKVRYHRLYFSVKGTHYILKIWHTYMQIFQKYSTQIHAYKNGL